MMGTTLDISPATLKAANISPTTFLATDFLNHYNEVAMLIDLLSIDPEVSEDILEWKPLTYAEHFEHSGFRDKELAIAAYAQADASLISSFETCCSDLDSEILKIQAMLNDSDTDTAASKGKSLYAFIAEINTLIVGGGETSEKTDDSSSAQSAIDDLFS